MKRLDINLYTITVLTETAGFLVVFTISRSLAERDASPLVLGLVGAAHALTYGIMSLIGGRLADRTDNRTLLMCGALLVAAAATAIVWLRPGNGWAIVPYGMVGAGQGVIYTAVIAWMSRAFGHHVGRTGISRSLIMFSLAWNVGMIVGQGGGGWLYSIDNRTPAVAAAGLALTILAIAAFTPRSAVAALHDAVVPTPDIAARRQLSASFMLLGWLANLGGTFCIGMLFHLLPDIVVELHISSQNHGLMLSAMRCLVIGVYVLMYVTRFWHHRLSTSLLAQAVGAGGMVTIAMAQSGTILTCGVLMMGVLGGYNYFSSLYYSTTGSADDQRGAAGGMHEATLALGIGVGIIVGGLAGHFAGVRAPYVLGAVVIVVLMAVQTAVFVRRAQPAEATGDDERETPTSSAS